MKYRFYGEELQLVKYELLVTNEYDGRERAEIFTAVTDAERDELLQLYPDAVVTEILNSGYEWLDGTVWTQEQLKNGELERAIEMGEEAYTELCSAPTQEQINAEVMLEIAMLKAGAVNG